MNAGNNVMPAGDGVPQKSRAEQLDALYASSGDPTLKARDEARFDRYFYFSVYRTIQQLTKEQPASGNEAYELSGEALDIFDGLFDGIVDTLFSDFSDSVQKIVCYFLNDKNLSPKQLQQILSFIEDENGISHSFLSASIDILCYALHPEKWDADDGQAKDRKKHTLSGMAKLFQQPKADKSEEFLIDKLKIRAKYQVELRLSPIDKKLSDDERKIIDSLRGRLKTLTSDYKASGNDVFLTPYLDEMEKEIFHPVLPNKPSDECKIHVYDKLSSSYYAKNEQKWKLLNMNGKIWKSIYAIKQINHTPSGRQRSKSEQEMLAIIKAICYRQEKNCSWSDLPTWCPPPGSVYYFHRQWKNLDVYEQIDNIFKENMSPSAPMPQTSVIAPRLAD